MSLPHFPAKMNELYSLTLIKFLASLPDFSGYHWLELLMAISFSL